MVRVLVFLFIVLFITSANVAASSPPLVSGSYFKYNIINIPNSVLELKVKFENPYYDFATTFQPNESGSGLMYYEAMPSDEKGFVYITAVSPTGIKSDTFVIDNVKWWKQIENSKNGFVMEHTFRPIGEPPVEQKPTPMLIIGVLVLAVALALVIMVTKTGNYKSR